MCHLQSSCDDFFKTWNVKGHSVTVEILWGSRNCVLEDCSDELCILFRFISAPGSSPGHSCSQNLLILPWSWTGTENKLGRQGTSRFKVKIVLIQQKSLKTVIDMIDAGNISTPWELSGDWSKWIFVLRSSKISRKSGALIQRYNQKKELHFFCFLLFEKFSTA